MPSETFQVLVLSTAHLTPEVGEAMDHIVKARTYNMPFQGDDWRYWVIAERWSDYGWWVWADIEDGVSELPASLYDCLCFARDNGCRWVQFDCDGPLEPELQTYEW